MREPSTTELLESEVALAADERPDTLILACGAVAREVLALIRLNGWTHVDLRCLPAKLHSTPEKIAPAVDAKLTELIPRYERVFVAYADCGTAGTLDAYLEREGLARIEGAHCYEFYAGAAAYEALQDEEIGTFYLTDFLARQFDSIIWSGLGLDRHPELLPMYFENYRRVVYLAQSDDPELTARAEAAADRLGLAFERRQTGFGDLEPSIRLAAGAA